MSEEHSNCADNPPQHWNRFEAYYAAVLFVVAVSALAVVTYMTTTPIDTTTGESALFFLLFGLFTIAIGYHHPHFGYYSFDRVAQVASILVLGPLVAAWVNGMASFLYPWHRLRAGVPLRSVVFAAMHNAGLMALIILICGTLYVALGGALPLTTVDGRSTMLLILLVVSMQSLIDFGMLAMMKAVGRDTTGFFQPFSVALELGSGATAVLVALVYNSMSVEVFSLLLGVLSLGMPGLRQFANMRLRLEKIVEEPHKAYARRRVRWSYSRRRTISRVCSIGAMPTPTSSSASSKPIGPRAV